MQPARIRTPQPKDPLVGRIIAGCRLDGRLASGAFGVVYRGERLADRAPVAVKMLSTLAAKEEENIKRLRREADIGSLIQHPNIAAVHQHFHELGVYGLVMELVDGTSLKQVLDARGRLPWREAVHLLAQVGKAIAHLESMGVIHRDIKPGNILLTPGGVAKLIDLGLAKPGEDTPDEGLTMAGISMGSPAYMPPEQVRDAKAVSHAADVYSLGATLYHVVAGRPPFAGRTVAETMAMVVRDPPPDPRLAVPDLPGAIAELILWTLEKDPEQRPADANQLTSLLKGAATAPENVGRLRRLRRSRPQASRSRWLMVALGIGAVLLVLLVWLICR